MVTDLVLNLPTVDHRCVLTGQDEGGGDNGLIQCFQQGQGCHMLGDAHPNGFLSRVQHDLRNITSGIENEGISPWHSGTDGTKHPVIHLDILANLRKLAHDQGEVMLVR